MKNRIPLVLISLSLVFAGMLLYAALQELTGELGESQSASSASIYEAALSGNTERLRREAARVSDINAVNEVSGSSSRGLTPLMAAAFAASPEGITALLEADADVNARGRSGRTALIYAAGWGGAPCVEILLSATPPARVDARSNDGWTASMMAATRGETDALAALLAAGANVDAKNKWGQTALMLAAEAESVDKVNALIAAGADADDSDNDGRTALAIAASAGEAGLDLIQALLTAGARADVRDTDGVTPLMRAADRGDAERVIVLLNAGANATATDDAGRTALEWATQRDDELGRAVAAILRDAGGNG